MELTVQNVYGLLLRSKLLSLEEARTLYARWQDEAKAEAGNLSRFAAWMVANKYVTEYQAALLVRGHAEGFFLNEYKILDRLGKGRMAGVYKAQHGLGQIVAIKVLPPSKAQDPNLLNRFQREAHLAIRLKHPNIVRAFQMGQAGDLHYLVMEYLEGETLEDVLNHRGKLTPPEAVRLIHQALEGLQHIHSHGLVHRDLKPSNIMLVAQPGSAEMILLATVKILDMGLGRSLFEAGSSQQSAAQFDPGLTGEGVVLGTPDYMAPEQARDARVADIRADIYSLGCVLYQLLAGQPPFPDTNIISQMIRHATEPAAPLRQFNPSVPDGLQQIVNWMMAKEPSQRYPTPERAAQALQVFLAAGNDVLAVPETDPKMKPFLTWLQVENDRQGQGDLGQPSAARKMAATTPAGAPPSQPQPPAPTVVMPMVSAPARPSGQPSAGGGPRSSARGHRSVPTSGTDTDRPPKNKTRKFRKQPVVSPPHAVPAPDAPAVPEVEPVELAPADEDADVELITGPPAGGSKQPFDTHLDRRDFVMFGLGVGAGGLAAGIGCWLALRRKGGDNDKNDDK
jgi:serine/threonine protein kinase